MVDGDGTDATPCAALACATDHFEVDSFSMHDAEVLIAAIHRDWGEAQGNYD